MRGIIACQIIFEDLYFVVRVDHNTGARGNAGNRAAGCREILSIVVVDEVPKDPRARALLGEVRHIKDQNTPRIINRNIVEDIGI